MAVGVESVDTPAGHGLESKDPVLVMLYNRTGDPDFVFAEGGGLFLRNCTHVFEEKSLGISVEYILQFLRI